MLLIYAATQTTCWILQRIPSNQQINQLTFLPNINTRKWCPKKRSPHANTHKRRYAKKQSTQQKPEVETRVAARSRRKMNKSVPVLAADCPRPRANHLQAESYHINHGQVRFPFQLSYIDTLIHMNPTSDKEEKKYTIKAAKLFPHIMMHLSKRKTQTLIRSF